MTDAPAAEPLGDESPRRRRVRLLLRALLAGVGACVLLVALFIGSVWLWWQRDPSDAQRSRGVNALWAAHTWVGDPHTEAEYREFAERMRRHEISDVMFHAGPFAGDGTVPPHLYAYADDLLAAMDRYAPEVRTQAYLGQIEDRGGGILDLDDSETRGNILATAESFLDLGFDGIHYDIEPIFPGDESFLEIVRRTRALTHPRGGVTSVALEQAEFPPGGSAVIGLFDRDYHDPDSDFLRDVAAHADQVAIMTYDSSLPLDWLFGAYVAWQTEHIVEAIGADATVFIGVPTYDEGTRGRFYSWAEHIRSGIRGVRKGLDRVADEKTQDVGIAIFAEWTTTDDEWAAYYDAWIGDAQSAER